MKIGERISQALLANPTAWFLLAALAVSMYGSYQLGSKLTRVCDLTGEHFGYTGNPKTPRQELDNICSERGDVEDDYGRE